MENLQDTKNWINERLVFIAQNGDLQDADTKRANESLETALNCVIKVENKEKKTNDSNTKI